MLTSAMVGFSQGKGECATKMLIAVRQREHHRLEKDQSLCAGTHSRGKSYLGLEGCEESQMGKGRG